MNINHKQPLMTFRDHGAGLQGSHHGPKAAFPKLQQFPHTRSPLDRTATKPALLT